MIKLIYHIHINYQILFHKANLKIRILIIIRPNLFIILKIDKSFL